MKPMKNIEAFDGFVIRESTGRVSPQRFTDTSDIWMIVGRDPRQRTAGYDARQIEIVGFYEGEDAAYSAFVDLTKQDFNRYVDDWENASFSNITNAPWAVLERHINEWGNLYELQYIDPTRYSVFERILKMVNIMMNDPEKVDHARDMLATAVLLGFDIEKKFDYAELKKIFGGDMSWAGTMGKRMRGGEMFGT